MGDNEGSNLASDPDSSIICGPHRKSHVHDSYRGVQRSTFSQHVSPLSPARAKRFSREATRSLNMQGHERTSSSPTARLHQDSLDPFSCSFQKRLQIKCGRPLLGIVLKTQGDSAQPWCGHAPYLKDRLTPRKSSDSGRGTPWSTTAP